MNKTRICFKPECDTVVSPYMPFCAENMKNTWSEVQS